jgi:hypothetical protein
MFKEEVLKKSQKPQGLLGEIGDEVAYLSRRIEMMEETAHDKDRECRQGKEPLMRELNRLQSELQDERNEKLRVV